MGQGNRGAAFENLINYTNESYENRELAVINKRSTPVKVTRSKGTKVLAGFLRLSQPLTMMGFIVEELFFSKLSQSKS